MPPKRQRTNGTITAADILGAQLALQLTELLNGLAVDLDLMKTLKGKFDSRAKEDSKLIAELQQEVESLKSQNTELLKQNTELLEQKASQKERSDLENRSDHTGTTVSTASSGSKETDLSQDYQKDIEELSISLDLLEHLTGVTLLSSTELPNNKLLFDVKQLSQNKSVEIIYQLIINKNFDLSVDVEYIPKFMKSNSKKTQLLKSLLPEYLCESLVFNLGTISQFYSKVSKALNRKVGQ